MAPGSDRRRRWEVLLTAVALSLAPTALFRDRYRLLPFETYLPIVLILLAAIAALTLIERRTGKFSWQLMLVVPALITALDVYTLDSLVTLALESTSDLKGLNLLGATATAWCQNTVCFALWYYVIDRDIDDAGARDLAFTDGEGDHRFLDYVYVAATTGLAFSATDTAPLTTRMRLVMLANGLSGFLIVALAAAKALNAL